MKRSSGHNLYLALVHHPVVNKRGDIIASAVTNLDLHDIARASRTFGVNTFYVVTPLEDQKILAQRIISHWTSGGGATYNPIRKEAFDRIEIVDSVDDVIEDVKKKGVCGNGGVLAKTVATSAKENEKSIGYKQFFDMIRDDDNTAYVLLFGTAWGLAESLLSKTDYLLEPIRSETGYNHLSVRSAVSIILDRLIGQR